MSKLINSEKYRNLMEKTERNREIVALRKQKVSVYKIAEMFALSVEKIEEIEKQERRNFQYPDSTRKIKRDIEIVRLKEQGMSAYKIAKIFNISRQRVHQILKKAVNLVKTKV